MLKSFVHLADYPIVPFVYPAAMLLKAIRKAGVHRMPLCRRALLQVGVFPIRNHYYEPQFDMSTLRQDPAIERRLPGIDWNDAGQLELTKQMNFAAELTRASEGGETQFNYNFDNGSFGSGDAEFLYQLLRLKKPNRVFEIGSGNSTRIAIQAIQANQIEDPGYSCKHVCVEPYEMPWLEKAGVTVVRRKVEDIGTDFFSELSGNDLLFIDSSHVIRPDGDVLFEYLELLPTLKKDVIIHVHDIFSPRNYLADWLNDKIRFWNEQYLLESFLSHNRSFKILAALNYLHHKHEAELKRVCPYLDSNREPGSFYIQKMD